jgi:hypothetical protein
MSELFLKKLFIFVTILIMQKLEEKVAPTIRPTLLCFQKVGLVSSRVEVGAGAGAGATSKFLLGAGAA